MEKAKSPVPILCLDHRNQPLSAVNPNPSSSKHVYCFECLLQAEDPKSLYKTFPKIDDFITQTAATFNEQKSKIVPTQEEPKEFLEVVSSKAESLEKLSKHITEEKKKIETFFEHITNFVVDAIDQLKNAHLEVLEKQVTHLHDNYTTFEKMLKRLYPKKEDIETMFPTKEDLDMKLERIRTALDLEELVKHLKQALSGSKDEVSTINQSYEAKQNFLWQSEGKLKEIENNKPTFDKKHLEQNFKEEINKQLSHLLGIEKTFSLKNAIPADMLKPEYPLYPQSTIISLQEFSILKDWLPEKIKFNPKLLYRTTRDGKDSQKLSSQIQNKGPTITLIRCKYEGASQSSIIGGFLDKEINYQNSGWVSSDQSFIFSLSQRIKCPIKRTENAASINYQNQVWFGHGGTIGVANNFSFCKSRINSESKYYTYESCEKIIPPESYKGLDKEHSFELEDLEVFAVD